MPVMSIDQAISRHNSFVKFAQTVMREGVDYGVIPGTEKKAKPGEAPSSKNNTLLKPGAEKLCTLFGLVPDFQEYKVQEDWANGFFYYAFRCVLSRNGKPVASGIGSCNSREKKYRRVSKVCPSCGKATIIKSKFAPRNSGRPEKEGGWWCAPRDGGCSENFVIDDPAITEQSGTVDPMAAADLVNTIQKMAQKRALVAATLVATGASEFFTQDVEDMGIIEGEWTPHAPTHPRVEPHDAAEPVEVATKEQVAEIKKLITTAVLPAGAVNKWFAKAGVDLWEDMPADVIAKCIAFAKSRQAKPQTETPDPREQARINLSDLITSCTIPVEKEREILAAEKVRSIGELSDERVAYWTEKLSAELNGKPNKAATTAA